MAMLNYHGVLNSLLWKLWLIEIDDKFNDSAATVNNQRVIFGAQPQNMGKQCHSHDPPVIAIFFMVVWLPFPVKAGL